MFNLPVPCLTGSELLRKRVEQVLLGSGLAIWTLERVEDLAHCPEEIGVVLLEGHLLSRLIFRKAFSDLRGTLPNLRVLILIEHPEASLRPMLFPPGEICVVTTDLPLLPKRIAWARFDAWKGRVRTQLRSLSHLPFALREALVAALDQGVPLWVENGGTIHTIDAVARKIGVSRSYLSRVAGSEAVGLPGFLDACNALNAVAVVEIEDRPWSEVAVRMGYSWQSGLTQLLKRGIGVRPMDARSRSLGEWANWWERHVLDPLLAGRSESHTE